MLLSEPSPVSTCAALTIDWILHLETRVEFKPTCAEHNGMPNTNLNIAFKFEMHQVRYWPSPDVG